MPLGDVGFDMRAHVFINGASRLAVVIGVLLVALVVMAFRHGTLDVFGAIKSSLLSAEATLRELFSDLGLR